MTQLQRSHGELRLGFAARHGRTMVSDLFQAGALRARLPRAHDGFEATILNTAGGLTGGDALALSFTGAPGTRATIASQACEKIYRAAHGAARVETDIHLADDASLDYLPQPTIFFDGARLRREMRLRVASASRLLALEACILGRTAMGEKVRNGGLRDDWRVWRDGKLIFADVFAVDGAFAALESAWGLGEARAYATMLYLAPGAETRLTEVRAALDGLPGTATAWPGLLLTRLVISDGYVLMRALAQVVRVLRHQPLPGSWSI